MTMIPNSTKASLLRVLIGRAYVHEENAVRREDLPRDEGDDDDELDFACTKGGALVRRILRDAVTQCRLVGEDYYVRELPIIGWQLDDAPGPKPITIELVRREEYLDWIKFNRTYTYGQFQHASRELAIADAIRWLFAEREKKTDR